MLFFLTGGPSPELFDCFCSGREFYEELGSELISMSISCMIAVKAVPLATQINDSRLKSFVSAVHQMPDYRSHAMADPWGLTPSGFSFLVGSSLSDHCQWPMVLCCRSMPCQSYERENNRHIYYQLIIIVSIVERKMSSIIDLATSDEKSSRES